MAKQKDDKFASKLSGRIDRIFTANESTLNAMDRYMKRYKGEWWNEGRLDENDSKIHANYIFSTVELSLIHI